ncbi:unnamed protein product, partial [Aureobasidium mustum]
MNMTSWLGDTVSDKVGEAVAYKIANRDGIKPEPSSLLDVTENGSNFKVRMNMPSVSLYVLKVQGSLLTVTDGATSMHARLSSHCRTRFQNQYSPSLSFIEKKSITSTIADINYTSIGPFNMRIQLLLSSLTISLNPMDLTDIRVVRITPLHTLPRIKEYLIQLQQFEQSTAEPPTAVDDPVSVLEPSDIEDLEMVEASPSASSAAERTVSLKRSHALSSPSHLSSHRVVKPRIHHEDEDVIVQTGINLQQPVQLQSNDSQDRSKLLSLLHRGTGARASVTTDREQALRLGGFISAQMAPPPIPAPVNINVQPQAPSQPASQPISQTFESQVPMADIPVVESAKEDIRPKNTSIVQPESGNMPFDTQPKIHLPNNTTTSAQPEPLEVTQSSLPRVPPSRAPLPSQSEALAASLTTSSSHLLDNSSSSMQGPLHRAPPALMIKYARRHIPGNQRKLLDKHSSWWPPRPGTTFPHPNVPVEVLTKTVEAAERRAAKQKEKEQEKQSQEGSERERVHLQDALPATQATENTLLSWESSPESHTRSRMDTFRRSTNFLDPEPPPARLPPGELPPDSSAENQMQVDEPEVVESLDQISSSPPSGSLSQESYAIELDSLAPPQQNLRQLPEYPLGSPEESSSRSNPGTQPDKSELPDPVGKSTSHNRSRPERDGRASSPILEVAASPQPYKGSEEESVMRSRGSGHDELSVSQNLRHVNATSSMDDQPEIEDDVIMVDQPQANNDLAVNKHEVHIVADSPKPSLRQNRRTSWGLSESAETIEQRRAREKRQFFEERRKTAADNTNVSTTVVPGPKARQNDEHEKNPEAPDLDAEPKPDPMDVDESEPEPSKPVDPSVIDRAKIIEQWRRQSSQKDDRLVSGASTTGNGPESDAPGPNIPNHAVSEPSVSVPATDEATAPEMPVRPVRSLPPRPSCNVDVQARNPKLLIRQQIKKGTFGVPSRALWVGSLPDYIDNRQLQQLFAEFNPVSASAKKQSGFVNFNDVDTACRAFEEKHETPFHGNMIVCKFTAPRGPVPVQEVSDHHPLPSPSRLVVPASTATHNVANSAPTLTVDDLFRQLVSKRNFKGNRTAFETLCKNLHTSSDVPLPHWDNYVVLHPAEFVPYANRTIANGGQVVDYDAYWRDHLQKTAKPDLRPVLTPARLDAIFNPTHATGSSANKPSAPVTPQTTPNARRPLPPRSQETPPSTSSHTPRAVTEDLRRSVVERNAQSTTDSPRNVALKQPHPLSDLPDPLRTSKWLRQNFTKDPQGRVVQQKLYQMYKEDFSNATVPLMS